MDERSEAMAYAENAWPIVRDFVSQFTKMGEGEAVVAVIGAAALTLRAVAKLTDEISGLDRPASGLRN